MARRRREEGFDWAAALRSPSFTPSVRDVPALIDRLDADDDSLARAAERALVSLGAASARAALERLPAASSSLRARLVRLLGRMAAERPDEAEEIGVALGGLLEDGDERTRRAAATALGRLRAPWAEPLLVRAWSQAERPEERRAIAAALGRTGGARAEALLARVDVEGDAELARIVAEARLLVARNRTAPAADDGEAPPAPTVEGDRAPARPVAAWLHCRAGLEPLLVDELRAISAAWKPRAEPHARGRVRVDLGTDLPLARLLAARLATHVGLLLPDEPAGREPDAVADAVARALTSPAADAIFARFSPSGARYRIAWSSGRRRGAVFRCVRAVAAKRPSLINDPSSRAWEVVVHERSGHVTVELAPHLDDRRFAWRVADVPAASHPTLAAALARVAGACEGDVVWDPFVGSALELVERARLGRPRRLIGSDTDDSALAAARRNLAAAGVSAELILGDALALAPEGVTLVLTNPPLGRRVAIDAVPLLERFVAHAARLLVPGGRLVWLSPVGERTAAAARAAGLHVALRLAVDMGGFHAELQRFERPVSERPAAPRRPRP